MGFPAGLKSLDVEDRVTRKCLAGLMASNNTWRGCRG